MGRRSLEFDEMTTEAQADLASLLNLQSEGADMFPPDVVERVENLRAGVVDISQLNGLLNRVSEGLDLDSDVA